MSDSLQPPWTVAAVNGILQARILEWVAIPFSKGLPQPRDQESPLQGDPLQYRATREAQNRRNHIQLLISKQEIDLIKTLLD